MTCLPQIGSLSKNVADTALLERGVHAASTYSPDGASVCNRTILKSRAVKRREVLAPIRFAKAVCFFLWLCLFVLPVRAEPVAKVVRSYAITSANDFPQRDPQDWRLLGSSDGTNWAAVDVRKGEVFSSRHQRKVFVTDNHQAFNIYRLQIDKVRDPSAADCVQLAEIEPMGETQDDIDPAPFFQDHLTAQGENAPWETRFQAFDGRTETKWLDHAMQNRRTRATWIQWQYVSRDSVLVTNVKDLRSLRSRAAKGYAVRMEGVVAGWLRDTNVLCFLDRTGDVEIPLLEKDPLLAPGRHVVMEGLTAWSNKTVGVTQCRLFPGAGAPAILPKKISPGEKMESVENWPWVETEGEVRFCTRAENNVAFELENEGRRVLVHVLHAGPDESLQWTGTRVRIQGVCEPVLDTSGARVAGAIWVPDTAAITLLKPAISGSSPPGNIRSNLESAQILTSIPEIRRLDRQQLQRHPAAQVRGVTTEIFGAYMQEENAGVELWYGTGVSNQLPEFGSLIEVEGKADWALGHGPIIRVDALKVLGKAKLPDAERCSWGQLASGSMVDEWVEVEAVVRSTDGSHLLLSCEGGQLMATIRSGRASEVKQLVDATVRARGVCVAATDSRGRMQGIQLLIPSLEQVEIEQPAPPPFALPPTPMASLLQVNGSRELIHRVKVQGILTLQDGRTYFVQDGTNSAMAIGRQEVVLTFPSPGQSWFFWQATPNENPADEVPRLEPGDRIEVEGFPETRGFSPILTEVIVRKAGTGAKVKPVTVTVEQLARGGLDSSMVSLEAVLLRQELSGPNFMLELQSGQRIFQALLPSFGKPLPPIAPGSRLRIAGVCQVEPSPYAELGQRVASFKLLLGSMADVAVLEEPSWWTLPRALIAAGALVVVLALALAWIGVLRKQVEQRTKELKQEVAEHEQTEARLAEETRRVHAEIEQRTRMEAEIERGHKELLRASRLAGMTEVATSVLHNVGNVLNGVNVLAASISDQIQRSKAPSVKQVAGLLAGNGDDLQRFVTEDARGRQLPGYVERLGTHLETEQTKLLEKVTALTESVQHIKEIVATQQNYAKVFGQKETIRLADIVEDALRMHSAALGRNHIEVARDFEEAPPVTIDRHKLLQILFNLLENATYACNASGKAERQVTVRIRKNGNYIRVQVIDNGIGIPSENLTRIFAQEFTTRKDGHGFGLHSSVLAAQDMGGSLAAESPGPGGGATFTLELPIKAPEA